MADFSAATRVNSSVYKNIKQKQNNILSLTLILAASNPELNSQLEDK
jgi:hypothetical protein